MSTFNYRIMLHVKNYKWPDDSKFPTMVLADIDGSHDARLPPAVATMTQRGLTITHEGYSTNRYLLEPDPHRPHERHSASGTIVLNYMSNDRGRIRVRITLDAPLTVGSRMFVEIDDRLSAIEEKPKKEKPKMEKPDQDREMTLVLNGVRIVVSASLVRPPVAAAAAADEARRDDMFEKAAYAVIGELTK